MNNLHLIFNGQPTTLQPGDVVEVWTPGYVRGLTLNFFRPTKENEEEIQYQRVEFSSLNYQAAPEYIVGMENDNREIWTLIELLVYLSPDISRCERTPDEYKPHHYTVTHKDCWILY